MSDEHDPDDDLRDDEAWQAFDAAIDPPRRWALLAAEAELAALKARRCDGCQWWLPLTPRDGGPAVVGVCDDRGTAAVEVVLDWPDDATAWMETRADHACNAWTAR